MLRLTFSALLLLACSVPTIAQEVSRCGTSLTFKNVYGVATGYRLWVTDSAGTLLWFRDFWVPNSQGTVSLNIQDESGRGEGLKSGRTYRLYFQAFGFGVCCGAFSTYEISLSGDLVFAAGTPGCTSGPCRKAQHFYPPGNLVAQSFSFGIDESGTTCPVLVDPVGDRTNRDGVPLPVDDLRTLATTGRVVRGISADGVSTVVVRIPVTGFDDRLDLRVLQLDGTPSADVGLDGGLGDVRVGADEPFSPHISLGPGDVQFDIPNGKYYALAQFRAPSDFIREEPCRSVEACSTDTTRQVHIQVARSGTDVYTFPVTIVRPPVVLVHGLNSDATEWTPFLDWVPNRLVRIKGGPFVAATANYGDYVPGLDSISPDYDLTNLAGVTESVFDIGRVRNSALGLENNAARVAASIQQTIRDYRTASNNPLGEPVAAVQADVVAHSMGGLVTRMIPKLALSTFVHAGNQGKGTIHKVITLGTPHFATPNGRQILLPLNYCVAQLMAVGGVVMAASGEFVDGSVRNGGAFDLARGDGGQENPSAVWPKLRTTGPTDIVLHISPIAGKAEPEHYAAINWSPSKYAFVLLCKLQLLFPGPDNMVTNYSPEGWKILLRGESDGVVPVESALAVGNLDSSDPIERRRILENVFPVIHSGGVSLLGLGGETLHSNAAVRRRVLELLNTPKSNEIYVPFR